MPIVSLWILFASVAVAVVAGFQLWRNYQLQVSRDDASAVAPTQEPPLERPKLLRDLRLSERPKVDAWLRTIPSVERLQLLLTQSGTHMMADQFLLLMALVGLLVFVPLMLLGLALWLSVMAGLGAAAVPVLIAVYKKRRRLTLFDQQLPDFLDSVARAMQAGNSFSGALSVVSRESPEPIGSELRRVFEEINFGSSVKEGLQSLALRVESDDVRYFVIAVLIHQQTGGSLTTLLLSLSSLIRDRQRLRKLGQVLSAEGRFSAWILTILPFATGMVMYAMNPEFVSILWTHPTGHFMVQVTLVLMVIGVFWMRKMIRFRI